MSPIRFLTFLTVISVTSLANSQAVDFKELKSQRTRQLCVHFLDGYLGLSKEQHIALEHLLKRGWNAEKNNSAHYLLWCGYNSGAEIFDSLIASDLEDVLSKDQILQFESLPKHGLDQSEQRKYLTRETQATVDPIKSLLDLAIKIEVQRIKGLLDLNEEQVRILRVAGKGAADRVLAERQELRRLHTEQNAFMNGFQWVKIAVEGPVFRIRKARIWNSALKKVLTDHQYSILLKDIADMSKTSSRVSSHSLAISYFQKQDISLRDYRGFTKLLEDGIKEARESGLVKHDGSMAFDIVEVLANMDNDRIMKSVSPDSWNVIKPLLKVIRNVIDDSGNE